MQYSNKKSIYKSKNKLNITIRYAEKRDAESLLNLKLAYLRNTKTIPLFEDEYKNTISQEEMLIEKLIEEKNSCLFVAEYNDRLIGNIDLAGNQRRKLFHTAVLGMGIAEDWQGLGIGTMLITHALLWSNTNHFLEIIMLEVYDSNEAGKALYDKVGFETCGKIQNYFKEEDQYVANLRKVYYCM